MTQGLASYQGVGESAERLVCGSKCSGCTASSVSADEQPSSRRLVDMQELEKALSCKCEARNTVGALQHIHQLMSNLATVFSCMQEVQKALSYKYVLGSKHSGRAAAHISADEQHSDCLLTHAEVTERL